MGARYPLGSTVARQAAPRMSMLWGSSRAMSAVATSAPTTAASAPTTVPEPALATPTAIATPTESIAAASTTGSYSDLVPAATEPATSLVDPELVSNIIAPLQYGDLAALGLTGWNPAALVRSLIEAIQVTTSMPWAPTIITTVVLVRLAVLPLHIRAMRNTARLQKYMPRLEVLKEEMNAARITGDRLALQRAALAQRAVYQEAGVKVSAMMLGPVSTLVSQLGLFFGIKTLCEFPLKQLTIGGPSWCPDLSAADPTYILPMINMIAIQASLWVRVLPISFT
jgi:YidC/Oxa1 family membrane protein insertase